MLPKKLILQAFGPYVEKQSIHFDDFLTHDIFLIRGETGSGKTVILDAMTYALYGKSSGGQRGEFESMRSRMADDALLTFVDFTFEVHNHLYRFYREVEVKRKRNQEVVMKMRVDAGEIINGQFHPFFTNPKARIMEEKAQAFIGLRHEQFIQVMILPQGKFEQFLTSKSEEKQEILNTLFQMERWDIICENLVEKAKVMKQEIEFAKQKKESLLSSINAEKMDDIKQWINDAQQKEQALKEALIHQEKVQLELKEELQKQYEYERWRHEEKGTRSVLARLEEQEPFIQQQQHKLEIQRKVQRVLPSYQQYCLYEKEFQKRVSEYRIAIDSWEQAVHIAKQKEERSKLRDQYEKKEEQILLQLQRLTDALPNYEQVAQLTKQYEQQVQTYELMHQKVLKQEQLVQEKQSGVERDQKELDALTMELETNSTLPFQFLTYEQARKIYDKILSLDQTRNILITDQETSKLQIHKQEAAYQELFQHHDRQYQAYLRDSSAQLAALLQDHQPCPVCGSCEHPSPTILKEQYVNIVELQQLQRDLELAKQKLANETLTYQTLRFKIADNLKQCQDYRMEMLTLLNVAFTISDYEKMKASYVVYQKKEQRMKALSVLLKEQQAQCSQFHESLKTLQETLQMQQQEHRLLKQNLEHYRMRLIDNIETIHALNHAQQSKQLEYQRCKKQKDDIIGLMQQAELDLKSASLKKDTCEQEVNISQKRMEEASAFYHEQVDKEQLQEAQLSQDVLTLDQLQSLDEQLRSYDVTYAKTQALLLDFEQKLKDIVILDPMQLERKYRDITADIKEQMTQLATSSSKRELHASILKQIEEIQRTTDKRQPQYLKFTQFVHALRGDNSMGLQRYILGVMLANITQHANRLLEHVHHGRFQIFRSDETSGKTRKYGLELSIYDAYSCTKRSVISLSGGEKFLVSLALSLALSSAVQAKNGGIHLNAMFIDEGFGTLDEHSIADALQILTSIGNHKGIIGIISHVEVLKENISIGIEVQKHRNGSVINIRKG